MYNMSRERNKNYNRAPLAEKIRKQEKEKKLGNFKETVKKISGVAFMGLLLAGGGYALSATNERGSDLNEHPELLGDLDPSIESITLKPDANIRHDHRVPSHAEEPNIAANRPGKETKIPMPNGTNVFHDVNGNWYQITDDQAKEVGLKNVKKDKDRKLWINDQGIGSINRNDTP